MNLSEEKDDHHDPGNLSGWALPFDGGGNHGDAGVQAKGESADCARKEKVDLIRGEGNMIHTGNYLDVLKGQYDCLITDPPYSARCHNGQSEKRRKIEYECWDESDYARLVDWALSHVAGWIVIITDHVCWFEIDRFLRAAGRYCFAPVPIVFPGCTCRFQNDGPSSWAVYAHVSRPASLSKWRTLPGAYIQSREMESEILGQKPLDLMIQIVRDYSSPGMMVVDPCAGMGTTLRAAQILGREWEGAELDAERAEKARRRMADGFTPEMI